MAAPPLSHPCNHAGGVLSISSAASSNCFTSSSARFQPVQPASAFAFTSEATSQNGLAPLLRTHCNATIVVSTGFSTRCRARVVALDLATSGVRRSVAPGGQLITAERNGCEDLYAKAAAFLNQAQGPAIQEREGQHDAREGDSSLCQLFLDSAYTGYSRLGLTHADLIAQALAVRLRCPIQDPEWKTRPGIAMKQ
eukprot:CAMPEP_0115748828 /NCGR_PEP_ID=MMETSP0272-20121206/93873_1 /TAXON_ID=71861 /ORGANISM="Scrippsiella trochoidea, Strain CCMP3099" /LENGTH=195 /DNA_ID=CAMNT_0003193851 /DNA_START=17 /DNA_END=604 /DNA_ORIENTATION=-